MSEVTRDTQVLFASAVIAYADTNEHALVATPTNMQEYKNLVLEIKVTTLDTTTAQSLTIGMGTSCYELTGAAAIAGFDSGYWETKVITLATSAGTAYYNLTIPANEVYGNYIYSKYTYGADPTGDPTVEVKLNFI